MSDTLDRRVQQFSRAARMLATIAASVKLRSSTTVDPAIREQIELGARIALDDVAGALDGEDLSAVVTAAEMAFAEGGELLRNADRAPGWQVEDPALLQAMGRASSNAFDRILALAETRPSLRRTLEGRFLDVGTGVAGIAIRAAEACPALQIDAIDLWAPALDLAERNIAASPHRSRIHLRNLDVTALAPDPRYSLAWLPTMFMTRPVVERALDRIVAASLPDAWLIAPLYTLPADPFMAVMSTLRTLRGGGEITDPGDIAAMLKARGCTDIEIDAEPIATFVMGRVRA